MRQRRPGLFQLPDENSSRPPWWRRLGKAIWLAGRRFNEWPMSDEMKRRKPRPSDWSAISRKPGDKIPCDLGRQHGSMLSSKNLPQLGKLEETTKPAPRPPWLAGDDVHANQALRYLAFESDGTSLADIIRKRADELEGWYEGADPEYLLDCFVEIVKPQGGLIQLLAWNGYGWVQVAEEIV